MQNSQLEIIEYIKSLLCPHHNLPIKYINYSTNVKIGDRLFCSKCAEKGLDGYFEIEAAIHNINQPKISQPIKNACLQLSQYLDGIKTKVDSLTNQQIYFLKNTQNRQGITKFQEETQNYYLYNPNEQNTEKIIKQGKDAIQNSIRYLERFQMQMLSLLTHQLNQFKNFKEIHKQEYQQNIFVETSIQDYEFFIYNSKFLEVFTTQDNQINSIQTIESPKTKITCITKAQQKLMFFLGRQDGIIEVYEQLTNGKYISSHQIQAHSYNPSQNYNGVTCIITNQDNSEIISGGQDTLIKQWKFRKNKWNLISQLSEHTGVINSLCYSLDYNILGSTSQDYSFSLFKSSQDVFQKSIQEIKQSRVNTICFVTSTQFFISLNQDRNIYFYQIINPLQLQYQIEQLYNISLNEINTDIHIYVQPRFYQQQNLLIFQSNSQTYLISDKDSNKFKIILIEQQNSLKGNIFRLMRFGQLAVQVYQKNLKYFLSLTQFA
ncbi:unnamed protein product [Paramecium primaurelia]|uniref:WD domain, G-beta repeat protein n=1 Tax=Paramecium primaurelia TaxID=5886 RepID=A0A8S1NUE9_PARPR|nr:unnamed protein product [Paramecium primaurelia]